MTFWEGFCFFVLFGGFGVIMWDLGRKWALDIQLPHVEALYACIAMYREERDAARMAAEQLKAQVDGMEGKYTEAVNHDEQVTYMNDKMYTDLQGWKKRCWAAEAELAKLKEASDA